MRTARPVNLLLIAAIVATTVGGWAAANRPRSEPEWPGRVAGFAFSPLQRGQAPSRGQYPDTESIDADLALIARSAPSVRTYSLDGTLDAIPRLAAQHDLTVTAGVDLLGDARRDARELARLRDVASQHANVRRAIIGNETLLTGTLSIDALTGILEDARRQMPVPVSTAEPWHIWMQYPELAEHVDFLTVHLLPYWEGIAVDDAAGYVESRMQALEAAFPGKPIVIGEAGWPSFGRRREAAVASPANAATFVRRFVALAEHESYDYYLMEAFDQPWKRYEEGEAGAYWGLYDVDRRLKPGFETPITPVPGWRALALVAAALASLGYCLMVAGGGRLRGTGRAFMAAISASVATAGVLSLATNAPAYWSPLDALAAVLLLGGMLGVVILVLVETHEWVEASWCARARRLPAARPPAGARLPKVSIHVPAHEEPPELLAVTLRALADLDYPDYEVVVVDNNTRDERLWRPVESLCASLGPRFRFFHVDPLPGYKAGALNFALRNTARDAELVAVVDSDYTVARHWLRDLAPRFSAPAVAIVQAPQDYRDAGASPFKAMCDAEYRGFFSVGMVTRNDRNAIIQHGTMTIVRKRVLGEVGGWDERTITEDAELGLRILEHGYEAHYVPVSYGQGLTPDNFGDYKAQRFRWALGAMQILSKHGGALAGVRPSALDRGQRYHFVAGWLPWIGDGLSLLFNGIAIAWSLAMIAAPARIEPPLAAFSAFVMALFGFKLAKVLALYRWRVGAGLGETLGAVVAGLGLVFTAGLAVLAGLAGRRAPFRRTPKLAPSHSLPGALAAAAPETALALALLACAAAVTATAPFASLDRTLWCALLGVFAVPHLAALGLSLASVSPGADARRSVASELEAAISEPRRG